MLYFGNERNEDGFLFCSRVGVSYLYLRSEIFIRNFLICYIKNGLKSLFFFKSNKK